MSWIAAILERLGSRSGWSYRAGGPPATEVMALAAMALAGHQRRDAAVTVARRLIEMQASDGSLGITQRDERPGWPTGLAVLAWQTLSRDDEGHSTRGPFSEPAERAVQWILSTRGETMEPIEGLGHDPTLEGWCWVQGTHSWIEPTAINLLALSARGLSQHPRARQAALLLLDRMFITGGCNYGNTVVLGQKLRPHVEPTALALMALAGRGIADVRIEASLDYLLAQLSAQSTAMSLAYGLMGLAAHARPARSSETWLQAAAGRPYCLASPHCQALLALAALGRRCPMIPLAQGPKSTS